jgi:hypothetical protein
MFGQGVQSFWVVCFGLDLGFFAGKMGSGFFGMVLLFSPGYILMIDDFPCLG